MRELRIPEPLHALITLLFCFMKLRHSGQISRLRPVRCQQNQHPKGKGTEELFEMLKSGKAGVAIHTKQNPGGELWGFRHTKAEHKS